MSIARAITGTLRGIARTLCLAEVDDADLYAVAAALQDAHNAVLDVALQREALREGQRILADWRQRHEGGAS